MFASGERGGAMPEGATEDLSPTVVGVAAKLALAALEKRELPAAPLLKRAGLSEREVRIPRRRISAAGQGNFLEYAAEALGDSALGLHLAEGANPRESGLLFYAMSAAHNLSQALAMLARYSRIVNDSVRLKLERSPDAISVTLGYVGVSRHLQRQFTEFGGAHTIQAFREIAGRRIRPELVTYVHARNVDLREFEKFYNCPVEFGARADRVVFSHETLATPLVTHDPHLLETLRPFCDEAARARRTIPGTMRAAVENEVQRLLPHGQAQAATIAKLLGLSGRTLSRRLAGEATHFAEVVDQLRQSLALQYLKEPGFTLAQIAYLLGYEGATSFNHAFKRWTGKSPSLARREAA
jgi:AraC-like DNA-binding protein